MQQPVSVNHSRGLQPCITLVEVVDAIIIIAIVSALHLVLFIGVTARKWLRLCKRFLGSRLGCFRWPR